MSTIAEREAAIKATHNAEDAAAARARADRLLKSAITLEAAGNPAAAARDRARAAEFLAEASEIAPAVVSAPAPSAGVAPMAAPPALTLDADQKDLCARMGIKEADFLAELNRQ